MAKIAIIISGNYFKSHIWFYTYLFDKLNIDCDIISWNRLNIEEPGVIQFNLKAGEDHGYLGRMVYYLKYRKFVIKQLEEVKYDKILVVTVALGVLLYPYLRKDFSKRYVFDIRDHSIIVSLMKRAFNKVIENSYFTVISSHGYLKWLPSSEHYYFAHNYPFAIKRNVGLVNETTHFDPFVEKFNIVTIGTLRDYGANRLLIESLGNNSRFHLKFVGSGPVEKQLIDYVNKNRFSNVQFYGFYKKQEELDLIRGASFLNILTGNDINSKTLTTNRFYLSAILGIPMIVDDDTYQGNLSLRYSLGCVVKQNLTLSEQLQTYLKSFDSYKYDKGRREFIETVALDVQNLEKAIGLFLSI